jgi:diacylglycerol kinase family enzyme
MAFIGNGEYLPHKSVPRRRARLDTGTLDVRTVESTGGESVWRLAAQTVTGRLFRDHRYTERRTDQLELVLHGDEPSLACDGEVFRTDPTLKFRVDRQALTVYHRPGRSWRRRPGRS